MTWRSKPFRIVRPPSTSIDARLFGFRDRAAMRELWVRRLPWYRRLVSRWFDLITEMPVPQLVPMPVRGGRWR